MDAKQIIACIDRMDAAFRKGTPKLCGNPACENTFTPTVKMQTRAKYCETCRKKGVYHKMRYNPKRNGRQRLRAAGYDVTGRKQPGRR